MKGRQVDVLNHRLIPTEVISEDREWKLNTIVTNDIYWNQLCQKFKYRVVGVSEGISKYNVLVL
jgi:hypothetical protein